MSSSNAWLLECSSQLTIGVGDHEIIECLQSMEEQRVPLAPDFCNSVLIWQDRLVPVMDIAHAVGANDEGFSSPLVCLLNYQQVPRQPLQQVAIRVRETPEKVYVDDAQAVSGTELQIPALLEAVTLSCFMHGQQAVSVVNISQLCSPAFRELVQTSTVALAPAPDAAESSQVESR